jgi:hypothetical protein
MHIGLAELVGLNQPFPRITIEKKFQQTYYNRNKREADFGCKFSY